MKHVRIKHHIKRPVKKLRAWYTKSPIWTVFGAVLLVVVLCGTSYGAYYYVANQVENKPSNQTANQNEAKLVDNLDDIDTDIADTKKEPKKADETKKDNNDPRAPTPTTGAGCAGSACYGPADFKIVASQSTVNMFAGEYNLPIKLKTVDGSKVEWGGTPSTSGVFTHSGNTFPGYSSSFTYYLNSNENASGTYHLKFYARKENPRQQATVTVTVKVESVNIFAIGLNNPAYTYESPGITVTTNFIFPGGTVYNTKATSSLSCPGFPTMYASINNNSFLHGYFDFPSITKPPSSVTCTFKVNASLMDGTESTSKTFKFTLK